MFSSPQQQHLWDNGFVSLSSLRAKLLPLVTALHDEGSIVYSGDPSATGREQSETTFNQYSVTFPKTPLGAGMETEEPWLPVLPAPFHASLPMEKEAGWN